MTVKLLCCCSRSVLLFSLSMLRLCKSLTEEEEPSEDGHDVNSFFMAGTACCHLSISALLLIPVSSSLEETRFIYSSILYQLILDGAQVTSTKCGQTAKQIMFLRS